MVLPWYYMVQGRSMFIKGDELVYRYGGVTFGCDPEFFFAKDGKIIGAEKVIKEKLGADKFNDWSRSPSGVNLSALVLDGVQVELNPSPHSCRANLGNEISAAFKALKQHLKDSGTNIKPSFSAVVTLDREELDSLSEKAKVFGCAPSLNEYDSGAKITVDASKHLGRSAGGHIHLGLENNLELMEHRERLVPLLDVIIGNTCVMLDRDPQAAERRKYYGRAGEYRLPKHGLEYRTLSNFWLRSYPLTSMVTGLARLTCDVLCCGILSVKQHPEDYYTTFGYQRGSNRYGRKPWDAEGNLLKRVNLELVKKAINENDLELAKKNWQGVRSFIDERVPCMESGLDSTKLVAFDYFLKMIEEHGLEYWFPEDPFKHWCDLKDGHGRGWEAFLVNVVSTKRAKDASLYIT